MNPLAKRLVRLENRVAWTTRAAEATESRPSASAALAGRLANLGIVPGANQSLADVTAQAMGVTNWELRTILQQKAAGIADAGGAR